MEKKRRKKKDCDSLGMGYYHFCTDGLKAGCLFYNQSQYAFGMTLIATITLLFKILIRSASKAGACQKQIVDLKKRRTNKMPPDKERNPPLYLTAINTFMKFKKA